MNKELLHNLVDPVSKSGLHLELSKQEANGSILEGRLLAERGQTYSIRGGIPRFVLSSDDHQQQTSDSFGFKWAAQKSYGSNAMLTSAQSWMLERYGFKDVESARAYFAGRSRILDAGCGSGFTVSLWMDESWRGSKNAQWYGVDLSAAIEVARAKLGRIPWNAFYSSRYYAASLSGRLLRYNFF